MAPNISSKPVCSQIGQEFCQVWATEKEGMLGAAETDSWDEAVLRTAARAFRAWRHAVAQVGGATCHISAGDQFLYFTELQPFDII